ncbi:MULTISPECIES: retropepsin-like aspartic protease [unclassified Roseofilum]|uniref:retropepsin-like aspartic protease family protein n=1 Tax=unclassified Roseofilum TaxID=2620099 RepID=UPI000E9631C2|nr:MULTISPECIES: retropepsin-like aspartic protease [unclassified Roseofilum]HBQ99977.1 aspartyl protease [Cyanobacteria bacterium UBA11691]MBP0007249.1 retroviral-like aspartic protease family protein [Roseofilum sp. Belize Diploria]MBP0013042.1 retroviral-like aspartic protease family protein [Roseofilum sp. SID3]MBP0025066.1 retroviral-like aspartic protease family protein [Roseofilum sp. SID2]MBP0037930.1 retroviral-like aspartic protease family protein [Roseofilum sp. SID1]
MNTQIGLEPVKGLIVLGMAVGIVACGRSPVEGSDPPTPEVPQAIVSPSPSPSAAPSPVVQDQKTLQRALDKAYGAASIAQSAASPGDWQLVTRQWQQAIALLQHISPQSPHYALAQQKINEYQKNLTYAQNQSQNASPAPAPTPQIIAVKPVTPVQPVRRRPYSAQPGSIQTPIKRREGGTPVIDVVFNQTQSFEMIVDTGATGVVITQKMAQSLNIPLIGSAKMDTASAKGVTVPIGLVESIAVKSLVVQNLPVVIAGSQLDIGLLGHDFFGDYDLIIRQDQIVFQPR